MEKRGAVGRASSTVVALAAVAIISALDRKERDSYRPRSRSHTPRAASALAELVIRDLIMATLTAVLAGSLVSFGLFVFESRREERQASLSERLENLRFVREIASSNPEGSKPFAGLDLKGTQLAGLDLRDADLNGAHLEGANLSGTDLTGAGLAGANLVGANLVNSILTNADLSFADLQGANLNLVNLDGSSLFGTNLTDAILMDSSVIAADFLGADFTGADLTGIDFSSVPTDIEGVEFSWFGDANFTQSCYTETPPIWPDTFDPPELHTCPLSLYEPWQGNGFGTIPRFSD